MAMTLTEASKLSNDILKVGVIENIVKMSPILQRLPFMEIVGNSLKYNRENALPSVAFYAVGDDWAESTPTWTQITTGLSILGGDADVDKFLQATRSDQQDLEKETISSKAKALRHKFEDTFINGDTAVDAKSFDGLDKSVSGGQTVTMGVNGDTLTLEKLDELVDKILGSKPEMLLMSKRSARKLTTLMRALSSMEIRKDEFGQPVEYYNGIPVYVNDWISDAKTVGTSGDCSTIYAFTLGTDSICGLQAPGGPGIEEVGTLQTKDALRHRIKWYVSVAFFSAVKIARLTGVRD